MSKLPYRLVMPENRSTSVIFASPHSGRDYGRSFMRKTVLDERTIRSSEDAFIDLLFEDAPLMGIPLLAARTPRAYVDLNRAIEEMDPALVEGVRRSQMNPRVSSGLGVIPRVVSNGRAIYRGKLSIQEANERLFKHWRPYHDQLQFLLDDNLANFGQAILIDLHSMPREAIDSVARIGGKRPDIVLGDRFGAACGRAIMDQIEAVFAMTGLHVTRNTPFAGAYIAQRYGCPSRNQHTVQVEIDRSLYMNEQMIRPNGNFQNFKRMMTSVMAELAALGRPAMPMAAE